MFLSFRAVEHVRQGRGFQDLLRGWDRMTRENCFDLADCLRQLLQRGAIHDSWVMRLGHLGQCGRPFERWPWLEGGGNNFDAETDALCGEGIVTRARPFSGSGLMERMTETWVYNGDEV
eukprot:s1830_g26.t1